MQPMGEQQSMSVGDTTQTRFQDKDLRIADLFDPYESWLKLQAPPIDEFIDPYTLLGLSLYEENLAKIEAGFARKSKLLKAFQPDADADVGADAELWHVVSDELCAGRDMLVNRERRAELNASLRRQIALRGAFGVGAAEAAAEATIQCDCGVSNPAKRIFCTKCGARLWRACCACNSERAIDEAHCGKCGVDLEAAERNLLDACQKRVERAKALAKEHRYTESKDALRRVLLLEDPRLHHIIEGVVSLRDQISEREHRVTEQVEELQRRAAEQLARYRFAKAIELLTKIPEPLRNESASDSLTRARHSMDIVATAESQVQELVKAKRLSDLADPIDELLTVKPDHAQVIGLANAVRDQLCKQAKGKLAENDYRETQRLLEAVPMVADNETVDELRRSLADRSILLQHLSAATVVSRNHVVAAKWLADVSSSEQAQKLHRSADAAWAAARRPPLALWRNAPKRTPMGCEVGWQLYPNIEVAEACKATFAEQPARWFVATGLALQGLGEATHAVDFAPKGKGGIGGLLKRDKRAKSFWGVDVGAQAIKAVRITSSPKDHDSLVIDAVKCVERSTDPSDEALLASMSQLRDELLWAEAPVAAAVSARFANIRTIPLPPLKGKKLEPIVQREAAAMFPLDSGEVQWQCMEIDGTDDGRFGVYAATKKSIIEREVARWETLGITPRLLTIDALAAQNAFAFRRETSSVGGHALLDIGDSGAVLSIEDRGRLWVRSLGIGGRQATDVITKALKVTQEQARAFKVDFTGLDNMRLMFDDVQKVARTMQEEVARTIVGLTREWKETECNALTCIGGGSLLTGLIDALRLK